MDAVKIMNDQMSKINPKLKKALNKFFTEYEDCIEGCIIRKDFDGADYSLIIESSNLYRYLSGEYGWSIHTKFYEAFDGSGYFAEAKNSCVINFYKE